VNQILFIQDSCKHWRSPNSNYLHVESNDKLSDTKLFYIVL